MKTKTADATAQFGYEGLDRVIHERARLSLLTSLMTHRGGLSFVELKKFCGLTDGNLARHLQVLEEEQMVHISKDDVKGRAVTSVQVTSAGRKRYLHYLAVLEQVVHDAAMAAEEETEPRPLQIVTT